MAESSEVPLRSLSPRANAPLPRRIRRGLLVVAVNVGLSVIVMLGIELTFGSWLRSHDLNRLHLIRSRTLTYNVGDLYPHSGQTIVYTRDKYGLRGSYDDPSEIDILTVGGSTTDQRYIGDGETWQDILQQALGAEGLDVVVANAGVDGHSTFGHLRSFEQWFPEVPGLRPQYVLFYVGLNDFFTGTPRDYDRLTAGQGQRSMPQELAEKSALWHLARTLYGLYLARVVHEIDHGAVDFAEVEWTHRALTDSYEDLMRVRLSEYAERLDLLIRKTLQSGARPIFVTQPTRYYRETDGRIMGATRRLHYGHTEINGADFYFMLARQNAVTLEVCARHPCVGLDLASEVPWEDADFYDWLHMTPRGARRVGTYLAQHLLDVLPREAAAGSAGVADGGG